MEAIRENFSDLWPRRMTDQSQLQSTLKSSMLQLTASLLFELIPSFVYYANYGNLDSEIYLPHVISNLKRDDLGSKEAAKARTLKVLFEYLKLKPQEIHDLGQEGGDVVAESVKKRQRDILLQSGSTNLTARFRKWWGQGNHTFRLHADGNHFRIWVSDDIRREEVELEERSAGLQWFLSFFLVFLAEREESHKYAILLLDEPGASLHPIAQQDLFEFFNGLSNSNQVFYTTHSPFMVNPDQLDCVRAVYFEEDGDEKGLTKVSSDLRARDKAVGQLNSVYPVHAALGISTSNALLLGSTTVIVEGTSDQYYLTAMKSYLIGNKLIAPKRELLFVPASGARSIKTVAGILAGKDEQLPFVLVDGDSSGNQTAGQLRKSLYKGKGNLVVSLSQLCICDDAEIEDLIPMDFFSPVISSYLRGADDAFVDFVDDTKSRVLQVEAFAKQYHLDLPEHWKVEVAKLVKERILEKHDSIDQDDALVKKWSILFGYFCTSS